MTPAELERLIDRTIGSLWRGLLRALDLTRGGDFLTTLERYLLARNVQAAIDAVDLVEFQNAVARLQQQLAPIREAAWQVAALDLPKRLQADSLVRVSYPKHLVDRPDVQRAIAAQDLSRIQGIGRETQEALREIITRGLREGTHPTKLAREIRGLIGLNRNQAKAVANYRARLLADGVKRPADRVERMVARYAQKKLKERAETIARTEVIRAQSEGRRLQWLRLVREGKLDAGEWQQEWITARDERTCFVAGTPVLTAEGERPIESLKVGDVVASTRGERQLVGVMARAYRGSLVLIQTCADRVAICTDDHPVWVIGAGWQAASELVPGDLLQSSDDQAVHVRGVVHLGLAEPDEGVASAADGGRLLRITGVVSVPIGPVHLNGDREIDQREVDQLTADLALLDVSEPGHVEGDAAQRLKSRLALESPVAPEGAEPGSGPWLSPESDAAVVADGHDRWSAAPLAAETARPNITAARQSELISTSLALAVADTRVPALEGAVVHPIRVGRCRNEGLSAGAANLLDRDRGLRGDVARLRAVAPVPGTSGAEHRAALFAGDLARDSSAGVVALPGTEHIAVGPLTAGEALAAVSALVGEGHQATVTPMVECLASAGNITVYDVEVDVDHAFYAAGFLVHNCPICAPMHGQRRDIGDAFEASTAPVYAPPVHPNCRCTVRLVARGFREGQSPTAARDRILRDLGRFGGP